MPTVMEGEGPYISDSEHRASATCKFVKLDNLFQGQIYNGCE
jgi:hypothetical protein